MNKSRVAGIVGRDGGIRIVVAQPGEFWPHVAAGETLYILPDVEVEEPVPWGQISGMIERVMAYVAERRGSSLSH